MSGGKTLYLLFESASGFALLEAKPLDAIGMSIAQVSGTNQPTNQANKQARKEGACIYIERERKSIQRSSAKA